MEFENPKPIYRQISDWMSEKILRGEWPEGERIPSVRDLAVMMQVNPNTAIRAFDDLQNDEIIFNRRGVGYFVAEGAQAKVLSHRREEFIGDTLPSVFHKMDILDVDFQTVESQYDKYKRQNKEK